MKSAAALWVRIAALLLLVGSMAPGLFAAPQFTVSASMSPTSDPPGFFSPYPQLNILLGNTSGVGTSVSLSVTLPPFLTFQSTGPTCGLSASISTDQRTATISGTLPANPVNCGSGFGVFGQFSGSYTITTGPLMSGVTTLANGASTNFTVTGSTFPQPPSISKSFSPSPTLPGQTSTLTLSISSFFNDAFNLSFTDNLPSGLVIATPSNLSNNCGGTATGNAGGTSVSLSGANLLSILNQSSCSVSVDVKGTVQTGPYNNSVTLNSVLGTANTATASLYVANPPTTTKSFTPITISAGGSSTMQISITAPASNGLTGINFGDFFPCNSMTVFDATTCMAATSATPTITNTCGGTATYDSANFVLNFSGGSLAAGAACSITLPVKTPATGNWSNLVTVTADQGSADSNTAVLTVNAGGPTLTSITVTPTNPSIAKGLTQQFTATGHYSDNSTQNLTASVTWASGTVGVATISAGGLATGAGIGSSTISATSGAVSGSTTLTVTAPTLQSITVTPTNPSLAKGLTQQFTATGHYTDNSTQNLTGSATWASSAPGNATITGGGLATGVALGTSTISATSGAVSGSTVLTVTAPILQSISVTPTNPSIAKGLTQQFTATGTYSDLSTQNLTSTATWASNNTAVATITASGGLASGLTGGTTSISATQGSVNGSTTLTVVVPPTISKAFGAATIPLNGTTTLSFTIANPNTGTALSGVLFTDVLPAGLAASGTAINTCGGSVTVNAGSIVLNGGSIAANGSCTVFGITITGNTAGANSNTTSAISSTNGGTGTSSNTAIVTVVAPPSISKTFSPTQIPLNTTSTLTFTITNANPTVPLTGVAFSDSLPAGMTTTGAPSATNCGSPTFTGGPGAVNMTGGSIVVGLPCTVTVTVTVTTAGAKNNTTGAVTSTEGGTGATSNTSTLTVAGPPTISKAFGAATIPLNGTTTLSFTIANPNATTTLTGVGFTDTLPAGLAASGSATTNTCGGPVTVNAGSILLSGGSVAANGSCTISGITITGNTAGGQNNTTGTVSSTEGGTGAGSNTATLTVITPPQITKAFGAATIPLNGTTTLSFTITNPNPGFTLTGVSFTDPLTAGLAASGSATNTCGGSVTVSAASIALSGGSISGASCTVSGITITGTTAGVKNNVTGAVTSTNGGTGATSNTATLTVIAPPTISKAFSPTQIALNGTSTLTITITNPAVNTIPLTGVAFNDPLPAGLSITSLAATGCGTPNFSGSLNASGMSVAAGGTCIITVTVTGTTPGAKNNTTGAITSTEGGTGTTSNTATLTVAAPPTISKSFSPIHFVPGSPSALSFTINNPNTGTTLTGVGFTDGLPAGMVVFTPNGLTNTCGGIATATAGSGTISLSGATLSPGGTCTFSVNITSTTDGTFNNSTNAVTSNEGGNGNQATASVTIARPPVITESFSAVAIPVGGTTTLTFTITNPNQNTTLTGIMFTDPPPGLVVSSPNGLTGSCPPGTITAPPGGSTIALGGAGGTLAPGASCTFSVSLTANGAVTGPITVTSGPVTTNQTIPGAGLASIVVGSAFEVSYAANLNIGESYINLINTGENGAALLGPGFGGVVGNICVNAYAFDPAEELVSCCSCLLTPDQVASLGANRDLVAKTLTGVVPTSITVKLLATVAGTTASGVSTCSNSAATAALNNIVSGMAAFRTTLHATPTAAMATTEAAFTQATLSPGELASITGRCASIIGNASGFGICSSCRAGALGGQRQ